MQIKTISHLYAAAGAAVLLGASAPVALGQDTELGENTVFYEDDALLDITEWFDGNDYNPTDEAWWRVDDEAYESWQDTSGDSDGYTGYGYGVNDNDDWFYDYYDPYSYSFFDDGDDGMYDSGARYYDYDNDGYADAYLSYSDWDDDGVYEDYHYYSFTGDIDDAQRGRTKADANRESRGRTLTGEIQGTKEVKVRGGDKHLVVAINPRSDGQDQDMQGQEGRGQEGQGQDRQGAGPVVVDLGPVENLEDHSFKVGDTLMVKGPKARVGEKSVVLAKSFEHHDITVQVGRNPRAMTGTVRNTHKATIRGQQHLMAMVEATQDGQARMMAVDFGPADMLDMNISEGKRLTFSGFPVKLEDKVLVMARSVEINGKTVQINRQPSKADD